MTSFVHIDIPTSHPGVDRFESAFLAAKTMLQNMDSGRGLATLLLAATVSALLVVANQVIEAWTDGHLLVAWIALWAVAFAALAMLASPARHLSRGLRASLTAWSAARHAQAQDRKLWELACQDARVMSEISAAMTRQAV